MSNTNPAWELQKAMVAVLRGDTGAEPFTLKSILGGNPTVLDHVPEDQAMPYLEFVDASMNDWDVTPTEEDEGYGKEHRIQWSVWSEYEGKRQAGNAIRRVEELFRDWAPALTGHRLINIRMLFSDVVRDPDGQAYQGVIQFRAVTEEL
jgi:hypothetical protein